MKIQWVLFLFASAALLCSNLWAQDKAQSNILSKVHKCEFYAPPSDRSHRPQTDLRQGWTLIPTPMLPSPIGCKGRQMFVNGKGWQCATEDECKSSPNPTICAAGPIEDKVYDVRYMGVRSNQRVLFYWENPGTLDYDACSD